MRTYDYEEWRERRRAKTHLIAELADEPRVVRSKPRDSESHALLERMALSSIAGMRERGILVRMGPRQYEVRRSSGD